jgi:hypothetical protein
MNRLARLEQIAGVHPEKLRAYKPFFEETEKALSEPRAKRIRREAAANGDDPDEDEN